MEEYNIIPIDITRNAYETSNSCDIYKGTSFRFAKTWSSNKSYNNDEYVIDFVAYDNKLWACNITHVSNENNAPGVGEEWTYVLDGKVGQPGKDGEKGHSPIVSIKKDSDDIYYWAIDGEWMLSDGSKVRAIAKDGKDGKNGKNGSIVDIVSINGEYYWTIDGNIVKDSSGRYLQARGINGKDGANGSDGKDGKDGKDGSTYIPSINNKGELVFNLKDKSAQEHVNLGSIRGKDGENGKVYVPSVKDGIVTYTLKSMSEAEKSVSISAFKGEKGDAGSPLEIDVFYEGGDRVLYYREQGKTKWNRAGYVGGMPGRDVKLMVAYSDRGTFADDRIIWGWDGVDVSEWTTLCYLDDLQGSSISDIEINSDGQLEITTSYRRRDGNGVHHEQSITYHTDNTVLPEFKSGYTETLAAGSDAKVNVVRTSNPKEWILNFSIPRGKDAEVHVARTVTVAPSIPAAVINEGTPGNAQFRFEIPKGDKGDKGDENIYIGCKEPTDKKQIWYDPCDESVDEFSAIDMLYTAYLQTNGKRVEDKSAEGGYKNVYLTKDEFAHAFGSISPVGFEIRVRKSFEDLGPATIDKIGYVYVVPAYTSSSDMYEEWVVVDTAETEAGAHNYQWERWGTLSIDMDKYYTKTEVDEIVVSVKNELLDLFNWIEL